MLIFQHHRQLLCRLLLRAQLLLEIRHNLLHGLVNPSRCSQPEFQYPQYTKTSTPVPTCAMFFFLEREIKAHNNTQSPACRSSLSTLFVEWPSTEAGTLSRRDKAKERAAPFQKLSCLVGELAADFSCQDDQGCPPWSPASSGWRLSFCVLARSTAPLTVALRGRAVPFRETGLTKVVSMANYARVEVVDGVEVQISDRHVGSNPSRQKSCCSILVENPTHADRWWPRLSRSHFGSSLFCTNFHCFRVKVL